ncbi:uncharacterized protein LOC117172800 isoform X2 [Belonocnema kinseyi]|nr:uncharacterized protein LOC117172800 isoform X2 [Belonocnema kinseyi]
MNNENEKDKAKEYNLKGIQVHRSCSRLLLDSPNKFDTSSIDDVPIKKLFVTNLAKKTTQEDLSKFFTHFGKVEECVIKKNKKSNYAFVTFVTAESALQALKNTNRLHEKELTVIPADSRHQPIPTKKDNKSANEPNEKIEEPTSSTELYPLVHRISDNCLMNIFQHLPIVDRVRVERVCRRWRDLSKDSWRTLRRLDVNSSSWGCKSVEIGTSDLYQVLKRCGRFLTMITFFELNRMMSLRTVFIIGKLCLNLKIAYLGTLEVTPREIFFLLSQCPNLEFLELDSYHFSDRDFSEIFAKSKKLRYVSFEESKIDGSCFISLPEETETIVFHEPIRGVNHIIFHSAIERLKNLQNLYLSVSHNEHEMGIPVFDDRDGDDIDFENAIYDGDGDEENQEMDANQEDDDESAEEDEKVFQDILMMINETEPDNDGNSEDNLGWGPKPQTSAKTNEKSNGENESDKKEYISWTDVRSAVRSSYNDSDDDLLVSEKSLDQDDYDDFESEEDLNDISSTVNDLEPKNDDNRDKNRKMANEAKLEKTDSSESKTDAKTDSKISDGKTSDNNENTKSSKDEILDSESAKNRIDLTFSESSNGFSRNHEFDSSADSFNEHKVEKREEGKEKESGNEVGSSKNGESESKDSRRKVKVVFTGDDGDVDNEDDDEFDDEHYEEVVDDWDRDPYPYEGDFDDDDYDVNVDYEDFFDGDYDDYEAYDDYEDYDDDGFDVENDFAYESHLANTIKETIRNCNKNLKVLQLKRCNPAGLTSEDLITNFTNFTSLERLDLSKMKIVNDDLLSAVGANCPKLSVLVINGCDVVTDTGIGGIALLPELKHLSMSDIPKVTGSNFETVSSLKTLYCARCTSLQEEGLTQLILNSHDLEQLDIQMCKLIANSLFETALEAVKTRTNSVKLKIFAKGSSLELGKLESESELLEILMERRFEERDSFIDGELGTEETKISGDLRFRDFRGIIFESTTTEKDKED